MSNQSVSAWVLILCGSGLLAAGWMLHGGQPVSGFQMLTWPALFAGAAAISIGLRRLLSKRGGETK